MAIAIGLGMPGINALLVASQVVLSIVLPFIISPLLYCTSKKAIMSVCKTRTRTPSGMRRMIGDSDITPEVTVTVIDVLPLEEPVPVLQPEPRVRVHQDSSSAERAVVTASDDLDDDSEMVDYSNNKVVIGIGIVSWLIIVVANVYVIVQLGLGGQT